MEKVKNKIGIDKISLTGFKIKNIDMVNYDLEKKTKTTRQKILKDNYERYQLIKYRIKGENYYKLILYPSRILWGNNIKNANVSEFLKALEWVKEELKEKGLILEGIEQAKIKEIEININLKISFQEYETAFKMLLPTAKIYGKNKKDGLSVETLETKGKTNGFKIYDKAKQQKLYYGLVRFEYYLKDIHYQMICQKNGYSGDLQTLIKKPFLLSVIFKQKTKDLYKKTLKYINREIKKPLKNRYTEIKKYNKTATKKDIKPIYKQLEMVEPYGIFDKNILVSIIKESNEKNKNREIKKVLELYRDFNELEKLKQLYIFIIVYGI